MDSSSREYREWIEKRFQPAMDKVGGQGPRRPATSSGFVPEPLYSPKDKKC